jgi:basic membrane protein A and related proteins
VKKSRKLTAAIAVVSVALAATALVASTGSAAQDQQTIKVAVVTDIGGLNDKGFNTLANQGLKKAQANLGIEGRVYITQTAADRTPNLEAAARAGYDLVIANGVLFAFGPLNTVAPVFPDTKFVGVDVRIADVAGTPANVRGIHFKEEEAGCLVGNIAALESKRQAGPDIISAVGANKVSAIVAFFAGYKYCAKRANKSVRILTNYANDPTFANQAKCRATALSQIARGSKIVFQVAGGCGLGALDAAKQRKVWAIGVDADQYFFGTHVLTSATKHVEVAVYDKIVEFQKNPAGFKGGNEDTYSAKNKGVGYGRLSKKLPKAVAKGYTKSTNALVKLIATGKVKPPSK